MKQSSIRGFVDYNKLQSLAASDEQVRDLSNFEDYLRKEIKINNDFEIYDERDFQSKRMDGEGIRGARVRPGMNASLMNERLTNKPSEDGEFEVFRDDSVGISVYKKMKRDSRLALALYILRGWITGLNFKIDGDDDRVEAVTNYILQDVWHELIHGMINAIVYGFTFGEKVWQREDVTLFEASGDEEVIFDGKIASFKKIKWLDPGQFFSYFKNKQDEITRVEQDQSGKKVSVKRKKLVWFALDKEFSGIFGNSRFKNAYEDWYYGKINKQQMLRHTQRCGTPPLKVRYPEGGTQVDGEYLDNSTIASNMAKQFVNNQVALLSSEHEEGNPLWDIGFDDIEKPTNEAFLEVIGELDKKKLEGLGIPHAILSGDSTFAESKSQAEVMIVVVEDLVSQIEEAVQKEVVDQIVEFNFGPEFVGEVSIKIDKSALGRRKLFKDILKNTLRMAASKAFSGHLPSTMPDISDMLDELSIPSSSFDKVMNKKDFIEEDEAQEDDGGLDPMKEKQRDDESNNIDRVNPTDRDEPEDSIQDESNIREGD